MLNKYTIIGICAALTSTAVSAEEISYSYIDLGYSVVEPDDSSFDDSLKGFDLAGSFAITESIYGFAAYSQLGLSENATFDTGTEIINLGEVDLDLNTLAAGVGYNYSFSPVLSGYAELAYVNVEVETELSANQNIMPPIDTTGTSFSDDESGLGVGVGLRGLLGDTHMEWKAGLAYVDIDNVDSNTALELEGLYNFSNGFSLGGRLDADSDAIGYGLFARFRFGQ